MNQRFGKFISGVSVMAVGASMEGNACGNPSQATAKDKGNYLCSECSSGFDPVLDGDGMIFLKSTINADGVGQWRSGDVVTITNGGSFATYQYAAGGQWVAKSMGSGEGPGTPINHDKDSTTECTPQNQAHAANTATYGGGSEDSFPYFDVTDSGWWPTDTGGGMVGTVTIEDA